MKNSTIFLVINHAPTNRGLKIGGLMKKCKLFLGLVFFTIVFFIASSNSYCQNTGIDKELKKEQKKEYKKKIKELKKDGFTKTTGSPSMEVALLKFYQKRDESDANQEMVVTVSNCPTEGLCEKKSLPDAINQYATICKNEVKAKITGDATLGELKNKDAFDKFYQAYTIYVTANASQILNNYKVTFVKEVKEGENKINYTYRTWYLINEEHAASLRLSSAQRALEETKIKIEYGKAIENYVTGKVDIPPIYK